MMAEQPDEARCAFFLQKKRRYCRFRPNGNAKYCPEHAGALGIDQGRERILCPLNPKHSCYKDSLEKHLKKCRKQEKASPPYLSKGINLDADVDNNEREIKTPLKDCSTVELQNLIEKVHRLYDEHVKHIDEEILHHPCMDEELYNESYGIPAIRHRKQQASLIGQLQKLGLLREGLCFVELGAGKGNLSHWIQQALPDKSDLGFVLVDYGHVRYKADNKHKWPDTGPKFERLRIDIADLNLGQVESISANQRPVVAVGKHLCGGATDFALRCVTKTLEVHKSEENASQPEQKKFKLENDSRPSSCLVGVTVALCCHHRCTWQTYVGKEFIKNCGLSSGEFTLLCKLSGWTAATWTGWKTKEEMNREISQGRSSTSRGQTGNINQGTSSTPGGQTGKINEGISSTPRGQETSNTVRNVDDGLSSEPKIKTDPADEPVNSMEEHRDQDQPFSKNDLQLSPSEREEIGRKCKRLIDIGRVHYLRKCGLKSQLKTYIDEKLTPENVVIVAKSDS